MILHASSATAADVWDLCALTSTGFDVHRARSVLRHSPHVGLDGEPALPDDDLERALFEAGIFEEVA